MFDENRYFDVCRRVRKGDLEDMLIRITVTNRGPDAPDSPAADDLVPEHVVVGHGPCANVRGCAAGQLRSNCAEHSEVRQSLAEDRGEPELLFTENETNAERLFTRRIRVPVT